MMADAPPLSRLPDWRHRLTRYLADVARRPYEPGFHDCALFAAGAVEAVTGHDPAAGFRGRYSTLEEGFELMRAAGFADHIAMAAELFEDAGVRRAANARPGDLAVIPAKGGPALGVVQGVAVYVLSPMGLGLLRLAQASSSFRVG